MTEWGGLARDSLLAASGSGPYAEQPPARPDPRRPGRSLPSGAAAILALRRLLPDREVDFALRQVFARRAK
ncbi:MAG: hypothetical protein M3017_16815 [Actinomycetota bacterium]|nr:hypothetical protein [Actinomycetota bacterium]